MKEFLESLVNEEGNAKLSKEEIKAIIAKNGEMINTEIGKKEIELNKEIDNYKNQIVNLEKQIETAPNSKELDDLKNELQKMKDAETERIAKEKEAKDDEILTNNIKSAFGDKKFVNDYTEKSLINEIKKLLKEDTTKTKSAKDFFEELTKDKEGIFVNPNKVEIPPAGDINNTSSREAHERELMGLNTKEK